MGRGKFFLEKDVRQSSDYAILRAVMKLREERPSQ
jgi:hypothetical protein